MAFVYATTGSGNSAGGIGWYNFGPGVSLLPGSVLTGLTGSLGNGVTVTFDLALFNVNGSPRTFRGVTAPSVPSAYFGNATGGYTGLNTSEVVLLADPGVPNQQSRFVISNITVTDAQGNPMPNYTLVLADGESTSAGEGFQESLVYTTDGGSWTLLDTLGNTNPPQLNLGGTNASIVGLSAAPNSAYVLTSQGPTQATVLLTQGMIAMQQGFAIGFAVTQVELYKNIGARRYPSDQFNLGIAGGPAALATTSGAAIGLQSAFATVSAIPGTLYTLNETMAPGSISALSDYTQTVTAVNLTPGGTTPVIGPLPETVTPAVGDILQYTITNAPKPVFTKSVNHAYAQPGSLLTYTVTVMNLDTAGPLLGVLITDPTPTGTTYADNLLVSVPYTGTDPATGITLTSVPAGTTATVSWQVQVNQGAPVVNPISNVAVVTVPGQTPVTTNPATTQISYADLDLVKTTVPNYAQPGDIVTYTITVNNLGTAAANNVVLTDPIPAGTTYVPGSVTGTVPFTGTPAAGIHVTGPILAGGSASFSFQVKIGNAIPAVNPIPNTAAAAYTYTVDPALPNGASGTGLSNTVFVEVSAAILTTVKTVDKFIAYPGNIITYSIAITNSGNVPADNVVISDPLPNGATYVAGSLSGNVAVTGAPPVITLTSPLAPGATAVLTFRALVGQNSNPNPLRNVATVNFTFTADPQEPNGETGTSVSNGALTAVFQNDYSQQISDLIESVALQEAALAAIMNAEGAKIQRIVSTPGVTPGTLLCLNKSVSEMTDAIALLQAIKLQKLHTVDCQITGGCLL